MYNAKLSELEEKVHQAMAHGVSLHYHGCPGFSASAACAACRSEAGPDDLGCCMPHQARWRGPEEAGGPPAQRAQQWGRHGPAQGAGEAGPVSHAVGRLGPSASDRQSESEFEPGLGLALSDSLRCKSILCFWHSPSHRSAHPWHTASKGQAATHAQRPLLVVDKCILCRPCPAISIFDILQSAAGAWFVHAGLAWGGLRRVFPVSTHERIKYVAKSARKEVSHWKTRLWPLTA